MLMEQQFPVHLGSGLFIGKLQGSKSVRVCYHFDTGYNGSSRSLIHFMRGHSFD